MRTTRRSTRTSLALFAAVAMTVAACGGSDDAAPAPAPAPAPTDQPVPEPEPEPFGCDRIDFVVPVAAGGGSDLYTRTIFQAAAGPILGVPVQVRNVPGDGQMLGASEVWRADPDGCTLITYNPPSITIAQLARGAAAPVDISDAAYVGAWGSASLTMYGSVDSPGDSLAEVIELYKNGTLTLFGAQDRSGPTDLLARVMKTEYGMDWSDLVSYDGGGDLNAAILRGEVPYGITTDTSIQGLVENGQAKVIAVLTDLPSAILVGAPTALEQGFSSVDFIASFVRLVAATPGSSPEQIAYLEAALKEAIESEEIQKWSADTGNPVGFRDAEAARAVAVDSFKIAEAIPNLAELLAD